MSYPPQQGNWSEQSWPNPNNQPYSDPGYQGYGTGYPGGEAPASGYGYGGYQPAGARRTNGLAVAAMVISLASIVVCWYPAVIGAIMGHIARRQIRERGEDGDGMALTAVIVGWIVFALAVIGGVLWLALVVWAADSANNYQPPDYNYPS